MTLVALADARARVLAGCPPLPAVTVAAGDALGLVTAAGVVAEGPVPAFANSAMDGYAVRAADTADPPVTLAVVTTIAAGDPGDIAVGPGQAARIMTGAPVPAGADAVVMVERTSPAEAGPAGAAVVVHAAARAGDHVRLPGDDIAAGDEVLPPLTVLRPGHLGVLASLGVRRVSVVRRPRVGVLSTGDELVDEPGPLPRGKIRDSNRPALLGLVTEAGCEPVDLGHAGDTEEALAGALAAGVQRCDAVLATGGVSVGDFDHMRVVLDELAPASTAWMQVAVKPAKPLAFAVVAGTPVLGLPGNPVSAMVSFELFARPALRQMAGDPVLDRPHVRAVAGDGFARRPDGKLHLVRVRVDYGADDRYHARALGGQGSHMLRTMAAANGLALVPDGDGVQPGGNVVVMLLP